MKNFKLGINNYDLIVSLNSIFSNLFINLIFAF